MKVLKDPQSGSRANVTASHSRYGQYERSRRAPTQTPSDRRSAIRAAFASQSIAFAALTEAQVGAWASYADSHPVTDSLGQSHKLDPHAMFVAINTNRLNAGLPADDAPPATDAVEWNPETVTVTAEAGSLTIDVHTQPADTKFLLAAGPQRSQVRTFEGKFSQLAVVSGGGVAATDVSAAYGAMYGEPTAERAIFVRVTPVSAEGVRGAPRVIKAIVAS